MAEWYYTQNGVKNGPVTFPELNKLAVEGRLSPKDLVWKQGLEKWVLARNVKNLFPVDLKNSKATSELKSETKPPGSSSQTKFCPACGKDWQLSAKFCIECGRPAQDNQKITLQSGLQQANPSEFMKQKQFSLLPNEKILVKGWVTHFKSWINVKNCDAYLTNQRFVVCQKPGQWSAIGILVNSFIQAVDISFQIPLPEINHIAGKKHGLSTKYIFSTRSGKKYTLAFAKNDWIEKFRSFKCIEFQVE